jgi:hypothetical protein
MFLMKKVVVLLLFLFGCFSMGYSQQLTEIYGRVFDPEGLPAAGAHVGIVGISGGVATNDKGYYILPVKTLDSVVLFVSYVGAETHREPLFIKKGVRLQLDVKLKTDAKSLETIVVEDQSLRETPMMRLPVTAAEVVPSISGDGISSIIKSQIGVSSNNELSSQYNVRGGNYDENLVYVNNVEIYRPTLVRSGMQEGLPFVNSDLTQNIVFSSGGFPAKYGDKMSSVLDIQYKQPTSFGGSVEASLLGAKMHVEGATKNQKFNYLMGARQKSNQYFLKSLPTKGDYKPSFTDVQLNLNWRPSKKWGYSGLGYYSRNVFKLVPSTRETNFGTLQNAYRLTVYYEGQEVTRYDCYLGSFAATYTPNANLTLKFIGTAYQSIESETYDLLGEYWLGKLDTDMGQSSFGDVLRAEGVGAYLEHARNKMDAIVANGEHLGNYNVGNSFLQWGAKFQYEDILDRMNEWKMIDSAGFTIPHILDSVGYTKPSLHPDSLILQHVVKTDDHLVSNRISAFLQNTWSWNDAGVQLMLGVRAQYWNVNEQLTLSPRANISYAPVNWEKDVLFRFSTGIYHQPPFYKELKDLQGNINRNVKAQEAVHFVLGSDWNLKLWNRRFKFITEAYYKYLNNIVPYVIDNVSIRYLGDNMAKGYATGLDFKLEGAFVPGTENWVSLSIMQTEQKIIKNYVVDGKEIVTGYFPRPTEQRVNFNLYFQDYIPAAPTWKVFLNLVFGTGLPAASPKDPLNASDLRMPGYKRVDIGFSKQLISEHTVFSGKNPLRVFKSVWLSAEVFNLMDFRNVISYTWVQDVSGNVFGVPNYLTPRQLNLRLAINF